MMSSKFRTANFNHLARFNSDKSNHLINILEGQIVNDIREESARPRSCTIAPSAIRCQRKSWFRLRGVKPDIVPDPDLVLNHTAEVGTFLHKYIQGVLIKALGSDWIDVKDYLKEHPIPYSYEVEQSGYETLISIQDPPIKFACDGIIRIDNKCCLFEIKSSDYKSWDDLCGIKPHHMDQINTYSTILDIDTVIALYVDRLYGNFKAYEYQVPLAVMTSTRDTIKTIQESAKSNLAPPKILDNTYMCKNCEYQLKCKEWG